LRCCDGSWFQIARTVEEEIRFLDQAYARDGRTGVMLQTLLETGARASELVQFRIEDVSLVERVIIIRQGKGGKRREVPIRRDLAQLLRLHIGERSFRRRATSAAERVTSARRDGRTARTSARP
jgi:integrase/recombinase XerD